jgi:hypothetical protein
MRNEKDNPADAGENRRLSAFPLNPTALDTVNSAVAVYVAGRRGFGFLH